MTPAYEFTQMGRTHLQRVDALARVTGRALYSQDVLPEGVLFATVLRPPAYGAHPRTVDLAAAERMPGVVRVAHDGSLIAILADRREQFAKSLTEKLLTYALGRGLRIYDQPAVGGIVARLAERDYRFSALVTEIVTSDPFRMRRGDGAEALDGQD